MIPILQSTGQWDTEGEVEKAVHSRCSSEGCFDCTEFTNNHKMYHNPSAFCYHCAILNRIGDTILSPTRVDRSHHHLLPWYTFGVNYIVCSQQVMSYKLKMKKRRKCRMYNRCNDIYMKVSTWVPRISIP